VSCPVLVVSEREIRALLDAPSCISAVERAFGLYAIGAAELPNVIHLDIPEYRGEIHVKAGYLHGGEFYAVKMASGFPDNPTLGLSPGNGIVIVFDARTGVPSAVLLDNGYITDLRTAAAGAIAAKYLARDAVETVAVIGTGIQARLQPRLLAAVRSFRSVRVWGRRMDAAQQCVRDLEQSGTLPFGCVVSAEPSVEAAVRNADIVITVTASRSPVVRASWLAPGVLVTAVGSDGAHKQELDVDVLGSADRVIADSLAQCRRIGEIHHALEAGVIDESKITELGRIINGDGPGRRSPEETIVCDLTGVGVQDVAAAAVVVQRARDRHAGT
jgi:ornithine cyclodeaminase